MDIKERAKKCAECNAYSLDSCYSCKHDRLSDREIYEITVELSNKDKQIEELEEEKEKIKLNLKNWIDLLNEKLTNKDRVIKSLINKEIQKDKVIQLMAEAIQQYIEDMDISVNILDIIKDFEDKAKAGKQT